MAGHVAALYLRERGHEVTGFARTPSPACEETVTGDALGRKTVRRTIEAQRPDVVVNGIGILNTRVDADPARGIYLNSCLPHELAMYCGDVGCKLIHISTDCVFSGKTGGYTETSVPDETSLYGRSKHLGEVEYGGHLTFRTSIIGPEFKADGVGLFHWFMSQTGTVNGFTDVLWSGVTSIQLASAIEKAAAENLTGLYQLSNNKKISKYDLLRQLNWHCRKSEVMIFPKEECLHAYDLGNFYRVPADNRKLNYEQYYEKGRIEKAKLNEFTSDSTEILDVEAVKEKLLSLEYVKNAMDLLQK